MRWAVFDLDGTVCNTEHREHLARDKRWDEFNAKHIHDKPYQPIIDIANAWWRDESWYDGEELPRGSRRGIIICTGRGVEHFDTTYQWLHKVKMPFDKLLMRPRKNFQADIIVKPALLFASVGLKDVDFVVEDRDKMVAQWRSLGLLCLQPRPGAY